MVAYINIISPNFQAKRMARSIRFIFWTKSAFRPSENQAAGFARRSFRQFQ